MWKDFQNSCKLDVLDFVIMIMIMMIMIIFIDLH